MANESLFKISCPSCEAVFAVVDPELIGQIVACPKCGGMILVEPPQTASETASTAAANRVDERGAENAPEFVDETRENDRSENAERRSEPGAADDVGVSSDSDVANDWEDSNAASDSNVGADVGGKTRRRILACCGVGAALLTVGAFYAFFPFEEDASPTPEVAVALNEKETTGKNDGVEAVSTEQSPEDRAVAETPTSRGPSDAAEPSERAASSESENGEVGEIGTLGEIGEAGKIEASGDAAATEKRGAVERSDVDVDADASGGDSAATDDPSSDVADDAAESVDGDFATPDSVAGEFNEEEFEKANQASSDETTDADLSSEDDLGAVASTTELTFQNELPTMKRAASEIDVEARFALRIRSIEFPSSPVAAVRLLSEFSGVPIAFDWDAFELLRPSTTATLELTAQDVSVGEALEKVASLANWDVVREKNRVVLKPKGYDPDALVEERFDVSDLTAGSPAPRDAAPTSESTIPDRPSVETLETLIRSLIAPNSWAENGGSGTLKSEGSTLIAFQSGRNRKKIAILLESLRALRRLDAKSDLPTEELIPESLAWDALSKTATLNLLTPTPLQNAIEILEKSSKFPFQIFWDDATLNEAGVGRDALTSARVDAGSFDSILSELLEPLGLTYLALSKDLLAITTKERAASYRTIETHFVVEPSAPRPTPERLAELASELRAAIDPESWASDADGASPNAVWIDGASAALIVGQSWPNQRAIRRRLDARASGAEVSEAPSEETSESAKASEGMENSAQEASETPKEPNDAAPSSDAEDGGEVDVSAANGGESI